MTDIVMDLGRLLISFCPHYIEDTALKRRFFQAMYDASMWEEPWVAPLLKSRETNNLFLLRALANAYQETTANDYAWIKQVCDCYNNRTFVVRLFSPAT